MQVTTTDPVVDPLVVCAMDLENDSSDPTLMMKMHCMMPRVASGVKASTVVIRTWVDAMLSPRVLTLGTEYIK